MRVERVRRGCAEEAQGASGAAVPIAARCATLMRLLGAFSSALSAAASALSADAPPAKKGLPSFSPPCERSPGIALREPPAASSGASAGTCSALATPSHTAAGSALASTRLTTPAGS